jgi:hypothetical protein
LHLDGKGGNLLSAKEYENFEFEWEWKLSPGSNNGVKYWVTQVGGKEWLGIEYQMIDDEREPDAKKREGTHSTAAFYDIQAPAADKPLRPAGEWNQSQIVVQNGRLEHWLNGKKVGELDTRSEAWKQGLAASKFKDKVGFAPGKGRLMLTDHGGQVWYRNLRLTEK